ncbi:MAG TPA: ABC transporter permease, partial [Paracoccaceae bacterium]
YAFPHPDWRLYYFLFLMVFYLAMTKVSEVALKRLTRKLSHGQATAAGEELRRAAQ